MNHPAFAGKRVVSFWEGDRLFRLKRKRPERWEKTKNTCPKKNKKNTITFRLEVASEMILYQLDFQEYKRIEKSIPKKWKFHAGEIRIL